MKRKTWALSAAALTAVFAFAAAAIDIDGYNIADRTDGSNLLCRADPHCRLLTPGEIALAKEFFGGGIDYKHIKVFTRPFFMMGNPVNQYARMWNGNIYIYDPQMKLPDLSRAASIMARKTYLHEMTHVWQLQTDPKAIESGLINFMLRKDNYNSLYRYELDAHKYFRDYNFEQQAVIVETYYERTLAFREKTQNLPMDKPGHYTRKFNRETRDECYTLDLYQKMISSSLPQKSEPKCAMYRPYQIPVANSLWDRPAPGQAN